MPPKKSVSAKGGLNYDSLIYYMKYSTYPKEVKSEHEKRNIRKRAKSFLLEQGDDGEKLLYVFTDESNLKHVKEVVYTQESQQRVFNEFHIDEKGTHLGREKLLNIITEKYYWQGICHKIREFLHGCKECQEKTEAIQRRMAVMETITKTENYLIPDLDMEVETESDVSSVSFSDSWITSAQQSLEPHHFWDIVEVKLLGPYLCNERLKYVMVFMDVFSLWPEAAIVETMSSTVVTHVIINLICRFGVMNKLLLGVEKLETEQLMPRTDIFAAENINIDILNMSATQTVEAWSEIRETMHHFVTNNPDWTNCLSFALLPHRISRGRNAEYSPAFLTYGRELNLPASLTHQPEEEYLRVSDGYIPMEKKKETLDTLLAVYKGYCGPVNISQEADVFKTPKSSTRLLRPKNTRKRSAVVRETEYCTNDDMVDNRTSDSGSGGMISGQIDTDSSSVNGEENATMADHEIKQEVDSSEEKDESPMYVVKKKRWSKTHQTSMDNSSNNSGDLSIDELQTYEKLLEIAESNSPEKLMISEDMDPTYEPLLLYLNHKKYPAGVVNEHKKRIIRKMSETYFIEDDVLYHRWKTTKRVVPLRFDERYYILQSYHVDDKGKHVGFKYMNEKLIKYHWKSMVTDCEAYVRTCIHCNQTKSTNNESLPEFFYDDTDEKRAKLAEENYSLLVKYLQKGKIVQSVQANKSRLIVALSKWFIMKNGQLYYKRPHNEYDVCLEVASRAKKNAIRDAHIIQGVNHHASHTETLQTLSEKYIWCGMRENCEDFVASCCNQPKPTDIKRSATFKKFDLQQRVSLFQKIREMQEDPKEAENYNNIKTRVLEKYNKILSEDNCNVVCAENMEVDEESEDNRETQDKSTDLNSSSQTNPKPTEVSLIDKEADGSQILEGQHQILDSQIEHCITGLENVSTTKHKDSCKSMTDAADQAAGTDTHPETNNQQITFTSGDNTGQILAPESSQQVTSGTNEKPTERRSFNTEQVTTHVQQQSVSTNQPSNSTVMPVLGSQQDTCTMRCEKGNQDNSDSHKQPAVVAEPTVNTNQQEVDRISQHQRVIVKDAVVQYSPEFSEEISGNEKSPSNVASTSSNVTVENIGIENRTVEIQTDYNRPVSDETTISAVRSILTSYDEPGSNDEEETESDNEESDNEHSDDPDWNADDVESTEKQKQTVVDADNEPDWEQLKKRYDNKTKFRCKHCDKFIKGVIRYRTHVYGHTGVKPFACEHCPKRFTTPKTKKIHMMKHNGLQQFLCNLCGKGFSTNTSLKSHIAVHDKGGNVQVKCEFCPRVFTSRNRYEKHVQYKHPSQPFEYRCEECNRNFTTRRSLIRHNKSLHQNIKGHICEICGKGFYRKEYLKSHLTTHGGGIKSERNYAKRSYPLVQAGTDKFDIVLTSAETSTPSTVQYTSASTVSENEVITTEYTIPLSETHIALPSTTVENQMTVESSYYITHTDDENQVAHMLVYEQPAVQYEVECGSSEQMDAAEALSAINMLAQASINQGY